MLKTIVFSHSEFVTSELFEDVVKPLMSRVTSRVKKHKGVLSVHALGGYYEHFSWRKSFEETEIVIHLSHTLFRRMTPAGTIEPNFTFTIKTIRDHGTHKELTKLEYYLSKELGTPKEVGKAEDFFFLLRMSFPTKDRAAARAALAIAKI
ncbi:MAG: hypothetical protein EOP06_05540 [Proteobacteria bacterium]|nr:MAG: hypothetical protein EOP06_05540 [Pseudomonadota bacterium]